MPDVTVLQMPAFKRVYKKLTAGQQAVVDDAVRVIVAEPEVGEAKKGDLAGVHVHKFSAQPPANAARLRVGPENARPAAARQP